MAEAYKFYLSRVQNNITYVLFINKFQFYLFVIVKDCGLAFMKPLTFLTYQLGLANLLFGNCLRFFMFLKKVIRVVLKIIGQSLSFVNFRKVLNLLCTIRLFLLFSLKQLRLSMDFARIGQQYLIYVTTQFCSEIIDRGGQVDVLFTDFSITFDRLRDV